MAEDGARIDPAHAFVGKAEARKRAGTEVLHHHVAFLDEPLEHALAVRILEVDGHAALVAIDREVVRGDPFDAGRRPLARLVT